MDTVPQRTNAFAELDDTPFTFLHLKSVIIAGAGFFGDAYDIFVIGIALPIIYRVYYPPASDPSNQFLPSNFEKDHPVADSNLKSLTNWGSVFGQLIFGYLADSIGRKKIYGIEIVLMLIAILGSALSSSTVRGVSIIEMLGFWRFILGLGIGGDYPLSATIISEFSHSKRRGMMVAAVFAMQGLGIMAGGLLAVLFLYSFSSLIRQDIFYLDYVWRLMLGVGAIPCVATIYYRFTMPESPRFKEFVKNKTKTVEYSSDNKIKKPTFTTEKLVHRNNPILKKNSDLPTDNDTSNAPSTADKYRSEYASSSSLSSTDSLVHVKPQTNATPPTSKINFKTYFSNRRNFMRLFATSYSWFALDIAWYGLTINTQLVLTYLGFGDSAHSSQFDQFWTRSLGGVLISALGTVPGYWVTVFTIEKLGRKKIQIMGFVAIAIIISALGIFWRFFSNSNNKVLFIVMFSIAQFFFNFGPNETTFIYPAELFPTVIRSRAHGISACCGKLGAIVGVNAAATYFSSHPSTVLISFGLVMLSGALVSFILPETKNRTLEDVSGEVIKENVTSVQNKTFDH